MNVLNLIILIIYFRSPDFYLFISISSFRSPNLQLERRLKAVFIRTGAWRAVRIPPSSTTPIGANPFVGRPEVPKIAPTVDTLDLNMFSGTPSVNLGRLLDDVCDRI